jgi:hypothetical protein
MDGQPPAPQQPADGSAKALYDANIAAPMQSTLEKARELAALVEQLPPEDKAEIAALFPAYAKQCPLGGLTDIGPDASVLQSRISNLQALEEVFRSLDRQDTAFTPQHEAAAAKPWLTSDGVRATVRALDEILNATNKTLAGDNPYNADNLSEPGKYDTLLALASAITTSTWAMQCNGLDGIENALTAHVKGTTPSTTLANATAEPAAEPPAKQK